MQDTQEQQRGTVKWFDPTKGYGFITPAFGGEDVFVHASSLQKSGLRTLIDGQPVTFSVVTGRNGKPKADIVKPDLA
jgi:cold shock protein